MRDGPGRSCRDAQTLPAAQPQSAGAFERILQGPGLRALLCKSHRQGRGHARGGCLTGHAYGL